MCSIYATYTKKTPFRLKKLYIFILTIFYRGDIAFLLLKAFPHVHFLTCYINIGLCKKNFIFPFQLIQPEIQTRHTNIDKCYNTKNISLWKHSRLEICINIHIHQTLLYRKKHYI